MGCVYIVVKSEYDEDCWELRESIMSVWSTKDKAEKEVVELCLRYGYNADDLFVIERRIDEEWKV